MPKRRTKEQKRADEIAALRQRLEDIAQGAVGGASADDLMCEVGSVYSGNFGRFLHAVRISIIGDQDQSERLTRPWDFKRFEDLDDAAEYLHVFGIRA